MKTYPFGFEENHQLRSDFIREITLEQAAGSSACEVDSAGGLGPIPHTLIQYWHDFSDLPADVRECMSSWDRLTAAGFHIQRFNDETAADYIRKRYSVREQRAFERCTHPAMRSDYFRMCYILSEGGFYVDADDVLRGNDWALLFQNHRLKVQPLCYDIPNAGMVPSREIWRADLETGGRIFYINNNPIVAPAGHPIIRSALTNATSKLLSLEVSREIQATTGPGNLTATLAAHSRALLCRGLPLDFELIVSWEDIARTRWDLSYRGDSRNWRNIVAP